MPGAGSCREKNFSRSKFLTLEFISFNFNFNTCCLCRLNILIDLEGTNLKKITSLGFAPTPTSKQQPHQLSRSVGERTKKNWTVIETEREDGRVFIARRHRSPPASPPFVVDGAKTGSATLPSERETARQTSTRFSLFGSIKKKNLQTKESLFNVRCFENLCPASVIFLFVAYRRSS